MKRPTLQDVAGEVGLSTASVSLVLRGLSGPSTETRKKVLEAAARLGYRADRAASLLARRRAHLIGVPVQLRDPYRAELAEEIQLSADRRAYAVALSAITSTHDEQRVVETLLDLRCEAILLSAPGMTDVDLHQLARRIPVVVIGRRADPDGFDVVRVADDAGIDQAVEHLVELGHSTVVHIDGGRELMSADRRAGFRAAVTRHGVAGRVVAGGGTEAAGAEAARKLLDEPVLPTAMIACNDRCAIGLLDVLLRAGVRVPGDVSLVGYDDSESASLTYIDLTTVNQDAATQAERAIDLALERLDDGRTESAEVVLPPRLIIRGTTGPARHRAPLKQ